MFFHLFFIIVKFSIIINFHLRKINILNTRINNDLANHICQNYCLFPLLLDNIYKISRQEEENHYLHYLLFII